MDVQSFVFDSPQGLEGLKMTAKRYRLAEGRDVGGERKSERRPLTLLFAHCVGAHKEQWEPTIQHLFSLQGSDREGTNNFIREAWSVDWQNHGDGAVVNRRILEAPGREPGVSIYEWADALSDLAVKLTTGEIDCYRHRLVAIGHSAGATALTLSAHALIPSVFYPLSEQAFAAHMHPYSALILTEPTLVTHKTFHITPEEHASRMEEMRFAVGMTRKRKWRWGSRKEAESYFGLVSEDSRDSQDSGEEGGGGRLPWSMWDREVVKRLVQYGLEPDLDSDSRDDGPVRLKCHPLQEAASYPNTTPHHEGAERLAEVVTSVPVHLVWGTRCDLVPEFIQDSLSDKEEGRNVASVTKMEDAGHMVVQEQPQDLAVVLMGILKAVFLGQTHNKSSNIGTKL